MGMQFSSLSDLKWSEPDGDIVFATDAEDDGASVRIVVGHKCRTEQPAYTPFHVMASPATDDRTCSVQELLDVISAYRQYRINTIAPNLSCTTPMEPNTILRHGTVVWGSYTSS